MYIEDDREFEEQQERVHHALDVGADKAAQAVAACLHNTPPEIEASLKARVRAAVEALRYDAHEIIEDA